MGRIQGLTDTLPLTGNQLLKTGHGYIFSITVASVGATTGNLVYFRDGIDVTAPAKIVLAITNSNGTLSREWANGVEFFTGIFYDEGAASNLFTQIQYK